VLSIDETRTRDQPVSDPLDRLRNVPSPSRSSVSEGDHDVQSPTSLESD
jgi:hypothetical protein